MTKDSDQLQSIDATIPKVTKEQAARVRQHARSAAVDDAEYKMFTGMLLGDYDTGEIGGGGGSSTRSERSEQSRGA